MTRALKEKALLAQPGRLDIAQMVEHGEHFAVFQNSGAVIRWR
jgi:hypothetical protein